MTPRLLSIVLTTVLLSITAPTGAQNGSQMPADGAAEAYQPLQSTFRTLATSLSNTGGMRQSDRATVEQFEQRVADFVLQWPDFQPAIAMQLQLALWLQNDAQADELFGKLTNLRPDSLALAKAWMQFLRTREMSDRIDVVAAQLRVRFPNDPAFELVAIEQLRDENQFTEALAAMDSLEYDPEKTPEAAVLHSELLFDEQRFDEALAKLDSLSATARASSQAARTAFALDLPIRRDYVDFWNAEQQIRQVESEADDLPRVLLVTDRGSVVLELFENDAPNTVANFISLVNKGFYDETQFHRVDMSVRIKGGDPNTKPDAEGEPGTGGPGYAIADEYTATNARRHFSGSLAMDHGATPNSAGSQFYITVTPTPQLNGRYTVFGRVIEGLDVVRAIRKDDRVISATVLRKRDHEYVPQTLAPPIMGPTPDPAIDSGDGAVDPPVIDGARGGDGTGAGDAGSSSGGDGGGSGDSNSGGSGSDTQSGGGDTGSGDGNTDDDDR